MYDNNDILTLAVYDGVLQKNTHTHTLGCRTHYTSTPRQYGNFYGRVCVFRVNISATARGENIVLSERNDSRFRELLRVIRACCVTPSRMRVFYVVIRRYI